MKKSRDEQISAWMIRGMSIVLRRRFVAHCTIQGITVTEGISKLVLRELGKK